MLKQKTEREIELAEVDDYINDLKKNLTSPTLITLLSQKSGRATMWTLWRCLKSMWISVLKSFSPRGKYVFGLEKYWLRGRLRIEEREETCMARLTRYWIVLRSGWREPISTGEFKVDQAHGEKSSWHQRSGRKTASSNQIGLAWPFYQGEIGVNCSPSHCSLHFPPDLSNVSLAI